MFQVNFSEQSMGELNALEKWDQMPLIEKLSSLRAEDLENPGGDLGKFQRDARAFYRLRAGDFRMYFERMGDTLMCHYILPEHTWEDFIFRFKLPFKQEQMVEQHNSFWKYLETLNK